MDNTLTLHFSISSLHSLCLKQRAVSKIILSVAVCLILPLLGFYIFQMGELIRGNYLIKEYRAEIDEVSSKNLTLQYKASNLLSLENIEEQIRNLDFVEVSEVKYIPITYDYLVRGNQ